MKRRLVWLVECVHGHESGCSFGDCVGGTYEPADKNIRVVQVTEELAKHLEDWSPPVQVRYDPDLLSLVARTLPMKEAE
jgi:hypothetical protein